MEIYFRTGPKLFQAIRHMKLLVQPIDFIENAVTVTIANHIVLWAALVTARIETPGPDLLLAGKADDAVTV
jgi:hypothetical protein